MASAIESLLKGELKVRSLQEFHSGSAMEEHRSEAAKAAGK
jgi:hypothetical protein